MAEKSPSRSMDDEHLTSKMSQISVSSGSQAPEAIIQNGPLFDPENCISLIQVINQEGPLFDPVNYASLIQIVNQLDPRSFVKFARTCKALNNFCYNTNGIRVQCSCTISSFFVRTLHQELSMYKIRQDGYVVERVISGQDLQNLQKMPFVINVKEIRFEEPDARALEEMRHLLQRFPRIIVEYVYPDFPENWNDVIQFLQECNMKRVIILRSAIPEDLLHFFLTKLDYFEYHEPIADNLIASATAKRLYLLNARISKYTIMDLIRKLVNGDIVEWWIGRERNDTGDGELDSFIEACSQVMKVVKTEEIDWMNMEPSVLFNRPSDAEVFYLLKSDRSIGKLQIFVDCVIFNSRIEF